MAKTLLEKIRSINQLLQRSVGHPITFDDIGLGLSANIGCSVYLVGRRGRIGGYTLREGATCQDIDKVLDFIERFPETYNRGFMSVTETQTNLPLEKGKCIFQAENVNCGCENTVMSIVPVYGGSKRLGTLIFTKNQGLFTEDDVVLAEYGATVVAMEMLRIRSERIEEEARKKAAVVVAIATLSYSEREAIEHIMAEIQGNEGFVVASRIADKVGITRSVIVSALRKFESAGIIESRSLGMKGTYIKVLNNYLYDELQKS